MVLLVVLIRITATCPALGVAKLQFTTTTDGKLLRAANSTINDPLATSLDNLPSTVIVELPGTQIGWLLIPVVTVPTGPSAPLVKFWYFSIYDITFLFLVISLV